MSKKRFVPIFDGFDKRVVGAKDNGVIISFMDMFDLLNKLNDENEQSKMMIATLRNIVLENEDLEKENKELSEQVEYLKKQVKIFRGECNRLTKENTELLEELND